MRFKHKLLAVVILVIAAFLGLFFGYPRGLSLILSYKKQCKVLRVEPFMKGMIMNGPGGQAQKFSIICDDGSVCRAEDTGFAAVKSGDDILFRGFPEFSTFEEAGKCDHAQLIRIKPQEPGAPVMVPTEQAPAAGGLVAAPTAAPVPSATSAGTIKVPGIAKPR